MKNRKYNRHILLLVMYFIYNDINNNCLYSFKYFSFAELSELHFVGGLKIFYCFLVYVVFIDCVHCCLLTPNIFQVR